MATREKMKPCPFCGSPRVQVRRIGFKNAKPSGFQPGLYAECTDCFAMKGPYLEKDVAEYAWNKRVDELEIVHCKDCVDWNGNTCTTFVGLSNPKPNDYCSRGERVDNGNETS